MDNMEERSEVIRRHAIATSYCCCAIHVRTHREGRGVREGGKVGEGRGEVAEMINKVVKT